MDLGSQPRRRLRKRLLRSARDEATVSWNGSGLRLSCSVNQAEEERASVLAAMMKSFLWRPRILWVHQVTVTLPHSVRRAGW